MFWELIAAVCAGLGAAGIALALRSLSRKRLPGWIVPIFAGIGMLGYGIYREYTWFSHQQALLPAEVKVVKTISQSSPFRPWTYIFPQVVRFIAMKVDEEAANRLNPELILAEVYLFERNLPARRVHQVYHCGRNARAEFSPALHIPAAEESLDEQWVPLDEGDPLLVAACTALTA